VKTNFTEKKRKQKCSRCTGWNFILLNVWCQVLSAKLNDYSFISADEDDGCYNSSFDDFDEEEDEDDKEEERKDEKPSHRGRRRRGKWRDQFCVMGMY